MRALTFVLALITPTFAHGQSGMTPIGHNQPQEPSDAHTSGVDRCGDHAMGFLKKHPLITFGSCPMVGQSR